MCRAVHHAHQKGLIHRDLKPSHVLVAEADGRPRLRIIDFGIAMALERDGHADVRGDGDEVVGTPGYMSPEQMEGSRDIDTRSDIYSLGVILYELLVGVPPFDAGSRRGWAAVAAQLQDLPTPTRRLSSLDDTQDTLASHRGTTPRGLRRELYGDLDAIVGRAMARDRSNRYETARELLLDLERYLSFEPVQAVSGGPVYWVQKFVRRHRVAVALVVSGIVAVGSTAALQARRVAQARDDATLRRSQAERLIDFMLTDLRARLEPLGRLDVLHAVGDEALAYFGAVPEQDITDEDLFRRVTALQQIGQVRLDQGNLPAAREAFEGALRVNLDLAARAPENAEWRVGLGAAHFWVGFTQRRVGDLNSALEQFQQYLAIAQELAERDPMNAEWRTELAYAHSNIGSVLQDRGNLEGALREFTAMRDMLSELLADDPENTGLQLDAANTHNTVGYVLQGQGRLDQAIAEFREEVRLKAALVASDTTNTSWRARLATGHNYLGQALQTVGDLDGAMPHYQEAVRLWSGLVARDTTNARWRQNLMMNHQRVASVLEAHQDLDGALERLRSIEQVRRDLVAADPTDPAWKRDEAETYIASADVLRRLGRTADASARAGSALAILDDLIASSPDDADLLHLRSAAYNVAGLIRMGGGDAASAREAWAESVRTIQPLAEGSRDPRYVTVWARALLYLDRVDEARPLLERLEELGYRESELADIAKSKGLENSLSPRVRG